MSRGSLGWAWILMSKVIYFFQALLYKRILLDYTYGIGKIYTAEEIEKAKQSPSFEREYNLKYLGRIGMYFTLKILKQQ
jgi:hypothetical protein